MSIFSNVHHYDSTLVSMDASWSTDSKQVLEVKFVNEMFELNYDGTTEHFVKNFEADLKEFCDKVIRNYKETLGHGSYEDCFYTMIDDFKIINCPYWLHATEVDISVD